MVKDFELEGREDLPIFQSGGFVEETGLAVIRKGGYTIPALGLEATNRAGAKPGQTL